MSQTTSRVRWTIQDVAALPDNESIRYPVMHLQDLFHGQYCSQQDLAEHLGYVQSTVGNFLNMKPVDRGTFIKICEVLVFPIGNKQMNQKIAVLRN
jgi:DNA-binding Xre family transcriptional regulator